MLREFHDSHLPRRSLLVSILSRFSAMSYRTGFAYLCSLIGLLGLSFGCQSSDTARESESQRRSCELDAECSDGRRCAGDSCAVQDGADAGRDGADSDADGRACSLDAASFTCCESGTFRWVDPVCEDGELTCPEDAFVTQGPEKGVTCEGPDTGTLDTSDRDAAEPYDTYGEDADT